jgi:hypothetical protein
MEKAHKVRLGPELRLRIERTGISFARLAALADCDGRRLYQNAVEPDEHMRVQNVIDLIERGEITPGKDRRGFRSDLRGQGVPA